MKLDPYAPTFGDPIGDWYRWFAWHPVETIDRGWRWLVPVWRRRCFGHDYVDMNNYTWFQEVVERP